MNRSLSNTQTGNIKSMHFLFETGVYYKWMVATSSAGTCLQYFENHQTGESVGLTTKRLPRKKAPRKRLPGKMLPGKGSQENRLPAKRLPGKWLPGKGSQENRLPAKRLPITKKAPRQIYMFPHIPEYSWTSKYNTWGLLYTKGSWIFLPK